ncbi:TIGR02266 family protein, partial [Myxococcus sp. CA039A]|uniref:TIGR02266 family protein n=1 Tax=Myxococcus sp. CA039A TaxID=2741737 RepID=UPI00359C5A00
MSKLLPLRIRLPYSTEEEFVDKYGSNVARGGVFVATRALKPEGTGLAFEFVLADGTRLLRGEGVVVKSQVDAGGGRAGMTVRFVKLDAASKALVDRVVARRAAPEPQQTVPGLVRKTQAPKPVPVRPPEPPAQVAASQDERGEAESPPAAPETGPRGLFATEAAQGSSFATESDHTPETPQGGHFAPATDEAGTPSEALSPHTGDTARHVEDTAPRLSPEAEPPVQHHGQGEPSDAASFNASAADTSPGLENTTEQASSSWTESAAATASASSEATSLAADEDRALDFDITASLFDPDEDEPSTGSEQGTGHGSTEQPSQAPATDERILDAGTAQAPRDLFSSSEAATSAVSAPKLGAAHASDAFDQEHDPGARNAASGAGAEEQPSNFASSSIDAMEAGSSFESGTSASVAPEVSLNRSGAGTSGTTEDTSSEVPWFGTPEVPAWEASPSEVTAPPPLDAATGMSRGTEEQASPSSRQGADDKRFEPTNTSGAPSHAVAASSRAESTPTSPIEPTSDIDPWGITASSSGTESAITEEPSTQSLASHEEAMVATEAAVSMDLRARTESPNNTTVPIFTAHTQTNVGTDIESTAAALSRIENAASEAAQDTSARAESFATSAARSSTNFPGRTEPAVTPSAADTKPPATTNDRSATEPPTPTAPSVTPPAADTEPPATRDDRSSTEPSARTRPAVTPSAAGTKPHESSDDRFSTEPPARTEPAGILAARSSTEPAVHGASEALTDTKTTAVIPKPTTAEGSTDPAARSADKAYADTGTPAAQASSAPVAHGATDASESTSAAETGAPTPRSEHAAQVTTESTALGADEARANASDSTSEPSPAPRSEHAAQVATETTAPRATEARATTSDSTSAPSPTPRSEHAAEGPTEPTPLSSTETRTSDSASSTEATASATQPATTAEQAPTTPAFQAGNTASTDQAPGATTPAPA